MKMQYMFAQLHSIKTCKTGKTMKNGAPTPRCGIAKRRVREPKLFAVSMFQAAAPNFP
jgi:hypothetical protein